MLPSDSKYDVGGGSFSNSMVFTDYLSLSTVKKRFASYLGGNTENADKMLQNMGVVDGLNGIKIKSGKISGNDVVIEISYKVRLIFYIETFHFGEFESTQKFAADSGSKKRQNTNCGKDRALWRNIPLSHKAVPPIWRGRLGRMNCWTKWTAECWCRTRSAGAATQHPVDQCGLQITVQYHRSDAAGTGGADPGA